MRVFKTVGKTIVLSSAVLAEAIGSGILQEKIEDAYLDDKIGEIGHKVLSVIAFVGTAGIAYATGYYGTEWVMKDYEEDDDESDELEYLE